MPRARGHPKKKPGTNNAKQAAARDAAAALRDERLATIEEEPEDGEDGEEAVEEPPETMEQPRKKQRQVHTPWAQQTLKRATIQYFYERLGCPPEIEWDGSGGAVLQIRDLMQLPVGQKHTKTIRRVLHAIVDGDTYDPAARASRNVKEHKLSEAEKRIAADCLIDGMGQWQAMYNVNAWRARRKLPPVSRTAVRDGAFSLGLLRFRRGTTDAGNFDKDSPWAIARLAQARQLKAQLQPSLAAYRERRDVARSSKAPVATQLKLEQIAFWDEKHSECKLGYASKHEYVMPNADGSVTRRPRTQPKVPELDNRRGRRATRALAVHKDAKDALEALHAKWDTY